MLNRREDYDVVVVGGGNAARCAAISAAKGGFYRLIALVKDAGSRRPQCGFDTAAEPSLPD